MKRSHKKTQTELLELNTTSELKNSIESFNSRLNQAGESVSLKTSHLKLPSRRKIKKNKMSGNNLWDL